MTYWRLIIFVLCILIKTQATTPSADIHGQFYSVITSSSPHDLFLFDDIRITSDTSFGVDEFEYITRIKRNTQITAQQIKQGIARLILTKRFTTITIEQVTENQKRPLS